MITNVDNKMMKADSVKNKKLQLPSEEILCKAKPHICSNKCWCDLGKKRKPVEPIKGGTVVEGDTDGK